MKFLFFTFFMTIHQSIALGISLTNVSALSFGESIQGDGTKTVSAGSSENNTNASFNVVGTANTAYSILLPTDGTIKLITAGGGINKEISINSFTSYPAAGANGQLNGSGEQTIFIGATRGAVSIIQTPGSYSTSFTVDVIL